MRRKDRKHQNTPSENEKQPEQTRNELWEQLLKADDLMSPFMGLPELYI